MTEFISSTRSPDISRRKLIAAGGAVLLLCIMTFAFVSGGKKNVQEFNKEPDAAVGVLQDGPDLFSAGSVTAEDWLNVPVGDVVALNGSNQVSAELISAAPMVSPVVTGDKLEANPPAGEMPSIQPASGLPQTAITSAIAENTTSMAEHDVRTLSSARTADHRTLLAEGAKGPMIATPTPLPERAVTLNPKPVSGPEVTLQANRTSNVQPINVSTNDSRATAPPATVVSPVAASNMSRPGLDSDVTAEIVSKAANAKNTLPILASGAMNTPSDVARSDAEEERPAFVRPNVQRNGLIAQSRSLVTERQIQRLRSAGTSALEAVKFPTPSSPTPPTPALVSKPEAEDFVRRTGEELRQQGNLRPTQQLRLPRQQETTNARIWRQEDTPTTTDERRPFGLVVEDTAPAFTPEGIPLRTDIPAGASSLNKTGADKPLWKRPK